MKEKKMTIEEVGKRLKELHDVIGVAGKKNCSTIIRDILKSSSLVSAVMRNNVIVKNGLLYRWNMKYRLSIELATLVYNDYMNIRFKNEKHKTTSKTNETPGYVSIKSLKNTKMSKWWYYEAARTGKIPFTVINGLIHIPASYVEKKNTPETTLKPANVSMKEAVDIEYFDRKIETLRTYATENIEEAKWAITLLKDRDNYIENKLNNLNDELVTLRIQLQQQEKSQVGQIRKFWRWLW